VTVLAGTYTVQVPDTDPLFAPTSAARRASTSPRPPTTERARRSCS
jgi:hypothetical protein